MIGKIVVPAQKVFNDGVFLIGLNDPVDRHVLVEVEDDRLRIAGHGIQFLRADVELGEIGRDLV